MNKDLIRELDKNFLEYDGKWIAKDKDGNCGSFTSTDFLNFIQSQLNKRDEELINKIETLIQEERFSGAPYALNKLLEDIKNNLNK